jgi:peptide deformylase
MALSQNTRARPSVLSGYQAVNLVAVESGKIDEVDAEARFELAIAYDSRRADLVTTGKPKVENYFRPIQRRNKALDEHSLSGQVEYFTVPAAAIHFATSTQKVLKLGSVARRSTHTHGAHNRSPFATPHLRRRRAKSSPIEYTTARGIHNSKKRRFRVETRCDPAPSLKFLLLPWPAHVQLSVDVKGRSRRVGALDLARDWPQVAYRISRNGMPSKEILQLGNPLLWQKSVNVDNAGATETRGIVRDLSDTLAAFHESTGYGRGISAPQIGTLRRVIFIRMQPLGYCGPLINPSIVWESGDRFELWDDCFSFPDLLVRVSRAAEIRVEYQDDWGALQTLDAEGDLSELLQHEIDHLDGILAVQRAVSPHGFATRAEWERRLRT